MILPLRNRALIIYLGLLLLCILLAAAAVVEAKPVATTPTATVTYLNVAVGEERQPKIEFPVGSLPIMPQSGHSLVVTDNGDGTITVHLATLAADNDILATDHAWLTYDFNDPNAAPQPDLMFPSYGYLFGTIGSTIPYTITDTDLTLPIVSDRK